MKKGALSRTQLAVLAWAGVLAPAAELLPGAALSAGRGAWLAPLAALPLVLMSVCLLTRLAGDQGLARGILDGLGPRFGWGVLFLYVVWALALLALRLRLCAGRMLSSGYRDGAMPYFLLAAAGMVFWLAGGSLAAFARAGQLFFLVLAVTGGAILLLSLPQVRAVRCCPCGRETLCLCFKAASRRRGCWVGGAAGRFSQRRCHRMERAAVAGRPWAV